MNTLIKIAWRNVWRNATRSAIVIFAIAFGIWSSIFLMGFMEGLIVQGVNKKVNLQLGHIQVHSTSWDFNADINNTVQNLPSVEKAIQANSSVTAYTKRFKTEAFAATAHGQAGLQILGVDPTMEISTIDLSQRMQEGTFLDSKLSYPIVVGQKLADDLKLKLNSKIQINFTNKDASQISKNFKVCGIYKVGDDMYEKSTVFVPHHTIEKLVGSVPIHEIVIRTQDAYNVDPIVADLNAQDAVNLIESWQIRFPTIYSGMEMTGTIMFVIMVIIILALLFGIINTLIMSILERKKELGVLMAVGMNKSRVRFMIIVESIFYGLIGGPIGVTTGFLTISYFKAYGFDLSSLAKGLEAFGYDPIIYFQLDPSNYFIYTTMVIIATIIGAIYPSKMATNLNPISAIRSV